LEARPGDIAGRTDLLLVDVRYADDLTDDFGHIHGVVHVPMEVVLARGLPGVDRDRALVVICQNGWQSRKCAKRLVAEHGFREVYHLVGGMLRWCAEDRSVARVRTWTTLPPEPG
jgi:rhodanese-related sulfurtransferase